MKRCSHCHVEQECTAFWRNVTRADGLQDVCKTCLRPFVARSRLRRRQRNLAELRHA